MQQVKSLVEKLNQQINAEAGAAALLSTVKMLEVALGAELGGNPGLGDGPIVVDAPRFYVLENRGTAALSGETAKEEAAATSVTIHPLSYKEKVIEAMEKDAVVEEATQPAPQAENAAVHEAETGRWKKLHRKQLLQPKCQLITRFQKMRK